MSLLDILGGEQQVLSVAELTAQIRERLEIEFFDLWVEGEVSNFKRHASGHWYFTIKDAQAQLRCAAFRNHNLYIRFRPQDGVKVRVRGYVSVYEARGEYQFLVNSIEPVGKGALQLAFQQLKNQLRAEGLFDEERKRPLPRLPRRVGIVTSPSGAAIRDILQVLGRRNRAVQILIYPARVQGIGAGEEIAEAISYFNRRGDVDVLIVGRGGGSIEDLWPFNEECVARAIFASRVPIISAVGHESDFTIADFVADLRAPTPSAAAELVAPRTEELQAIIAGYRDALVSEFQYRILEQRNRLATLRARRGFELVPAQLRRYGQQLDGLNRRLENAWQSSLRARREQLSISLLRMTSLSPGAAILKEQNRLQMLTARLNNAYQLRGERALERLRRAAGKLHALSPLAVLARGYALVFDAHGKLVKDVQTVAPGDKVRVRLAEGEMNCIKDLE